MGKSIFDKYAEPRPDPMKDAILGALNRYHLNNAAGCKMMGVSENTYIRRIKHQHTDDWTVGELKRMIRGLKIKVSGHIQEGVQ